MKQLSIAIGSALVATFVIVTSGVLLLADPFQASFGVDGNQAWFLVITVAATLLSTLVVARVVERHHELQGEAASNEGVEGRIKFYSRERRFGFAILDDGREVFIRAGEFVQRKDTTRLNPNTRLVMDVVETDRGPAGTKIELT